MDKSTVTEQFDENTLINILEQVAEKVYKDKKQQIQDFFDEYKKSFSEVNFSSNKRIIKTINVPVFLTFIEDKKHLTVQHYCNSLFDSMLLEIANSGVINVRKSHRQLINKLYGTNFTDDQDLYVEPNSRLDIFYKKCIEISTNT